jgi:hypothetical protein
MTTYRRSKNLDASITAEIIAILDCWVGKLTWELLLNRIESNFSLKYTRQTLSNHQDIALAFRARKKSAPKNPRIRVSPTNPELDLAICRINALEATNARLNEENRNLLEQFVRWSYNAYTRGIDHSVLNKPLPPVHRDKTEVTMESISKAGR